jgi:hypothetical protein
MEMHRADPRLRRALALSIVAALLLGGLGWWWLQQWLAGLADLPFAAAKGQLLVALAACLGLLCLSAIALAVYFWHLGAQVVVQGQFPLPGARVVRDVRMVRGEAALRYGRGLQFFGVALLAACLCGAILGWRAYQALAASVP